MCASGPNPEKANLDIALETALLAFAKRRGVQQRLGRTSNRAERPVCFELVLNQEQDLLTQRSSALGTETWGWLVPWIYTEVGYMLIPLSSD